MMDIVYALGTGSTWDNNEIRYSLRALEKNLKNYNQVFIIGKCPEWLKNVIHIKHEDKHGHERNIMEKIKIACKTQSISEDFLFINDDHFLLKGSDCLNYPYYHKGLLIEQVLRRKDDNYTEALRNTIDGLNYYKFQSLNYDIHAPIIYNKNKFIDTMDLYNWDKYEFVIKSLYCNSNDIEGEYLSDCKIGGRMARYILDKKIKGRPVFSIGDRCLQPYPGESESSVKLLLRELFPNKSKYEKE